MALQRRARGFTEKIGYASWLTSNGRSLVHRFRREEGLTRVPDRMLCGVECGVVAIREHREVPPEETPCPRCIQRTPIGS